MKKDVKTVVYDDELHIEAYKFNGIVQPFPNHFHEYYVIGLVEQGNRFLSCKNQDYHLNKGSIVIFNPGDNHSCAPIGKEPLVYRAFNIPKMVMLDLAEEVTGLRALPGFSKTVIYNDEIGCYLHTLHHMVMSRNGGLGREEKLILLITALIQNCGQPFESCIPECSSEIEKACIFMKQHFMERINLEQICRCAGLSKSTLLRAFAKSVGVTPYRYLENIRINEAKYMLEKGAFPIDAALQTGFSDQSHFTNYFSRFIGIAPGEYREIFLNKNTYGGKQDDNK